MGVAAEGLRVLDLSLDFRLFLFFEFRENL